MRGGLLFSCSLRAGSVSIYIDAPTGRVWELVSDVTRIGEFSPETFEAEWLERIKAIAEDRPPG